MVDQLLQEEKAQFQKTFLLYLGIPLLLWGSIFIVEFMSVLAILATLFGVYKSIVLLPDYRFIKQVIQLQKESKLPEFVDHFYNETREEMTNKHKNDHSNPSISKPSSSYDFYRNVITDDPNKYEMGLMLKLKKIYKSTEYQGESDPWAM